MISLSSNHESFLFFSKLCWLCCGLVLCLGLIAGCPPSRSTIRNVPAASSENPDAQRLYDLALRKENENAFQDALLHYERFSRDYPADPLTDLVALGTGRSLLALGNYESANQKFQSISEGTAPSMQEVANVYLVISSLYISYDSAVLEKLRSYLGRIADARLANTLEKALIDGSEREKDLSLRMKVLSELAEQGRSMQRSVARSLITETASSLSEAQLAELENELEVGSLAWVAVSAQKLKHEQDSGEHDAAKQTAKALEPYQALLSESETALVRSLIIPQPVEAFRIGALLPLSGRMKLVGQSALRGLNIALEGHHTELIVRDTEANPTKTVDLLEKLVYDDKVIAVIGPMTTQSALAAAKKAEQLGVPLMSLVPTTDIAEKNRTTLRIMPSPEGEIASLLAYARYQGDARFAILYPDTRYGQAMHHQFAQSLDVHGGTLVAAIPYPDSETNFRDYVEAIKKKRVDALFIPDASKRIALIAPTLAAAGLWTSTDNATSAITLLIPHIGYAPSLSQLVGRYLQGAIFSIPFAVADQHPSALQYDFVQNFSERYGSVPDLFSAYAFDALRLIHTAVSR
ncbi:MAG: penicillin-binding protein activator [Myxococcales bacterium]|nr:MAG: penicillin-binding protein activator [Myxococcales bacterium]